MRKSRINPISDKQKVELALRARIKREFIAEFGNKCMICGNPPDWRGIQLCHKIPLSRGGKTDTENCYLGCGKCHFTKDHHIREVKSKPQWSKGGTK